MEYIHHYDSPLGPITVACSGEALTGLWFEGQEHFAATLSAAHEEREDPLFELADEWLDIYFSGKQPDFMPPLCPKGTSFRKAVWEILLEIPYGETVTYGEIAGIIAERNGIARMSAQAVGGAVAHNPISLMIPCHRVLGADGSLTGYAAGIAIKKELLEMERKNYGIL